MVNGCVLRQASEGAREAEAKLAFVKFGRKAGQVKKADRSVGCKEVGNGGAGLLADLPGCRGTDKAEEVDRVVDG
ncbi:hypothetical protein HYQ44_017664 [Verticillium longisporum]|nr:hypothetical protein HYQ44_017664 [Verticillium longisporum]